MPKVGYRFRPTEEELLEYYLYQKITQNPLLYEDDDCPVRDWDLYGFDEPWDIWNFCGGNDLLDDKSLYFFTRLKRLSPSRFYRKIASGAWEGEDGAKPVLARGSSDLILGFRKRFRYENKTNPKEHGRWFMNEFTFNSSLLAQHSRTELDIVLCCIKKKESEEENEKANLGKKPRRKTIQAAEVTVSKYRAFGSKRKLKEAASPNSFTDQDGECFQNKRLRVDHGAAFVQRCSCSTQQTVESEGEIVESLPEDSTTFDVEKYSSSLDQILEHDCTEGHGDEGAQSNQLRGAHEESILVQQNHPTKLPCSIDILQILEREMESFPEDSGTYDVEKYSSILTQILHCTEENGDEGVQNKQLRGTAEETGMAQQNHPTELPCSNDIIQILEREMESFPEDSGTYDVEKYSSNLTQILHCTEENGDEGVQNKQLRGADEETFLVQQNNPTELTCSNDIIQNLEREMESFPKDSGTYDVEKYSSILTQILHCTEENGDDGVQNKQSRMADEETILVQQNHPTELPCSNDLLQNLEREMESFPEDFGTYDVENYSSILTQILHCTEENGDEGVQNKQLRMADEETILVQQNHPTELSCSNNIIQIMESEGEMESLPDDLTFDVDELLSDLDEIPAFDCTS